MIKKLKAQIKAGQIRVKQIVENNHKRRAAIKRLRLEHEATVMFDSVNVDGIPANAPAVAGYVDGLYVNFSTMIRKFPHAWRVPIAVFAKDDAECLDIESGDASPREASQWVKRQLKRGVKRPIVYTSASQVDYVLELLKQSGVKRRQVRVWSAHYTFTPHLCGPHSCGEVKSTTVDACQHSDYPTYDQSLLNKGFFG